MKRLIKILFVFLLFVCSCIFTSIYVMSIKVDESYKINRGEELEIESIIPITTIPQLKDNASFI